MEKVINVYEFRCQTPMVEPHRTVCPSDPPGSITQSFVTANTKPATGQFHPSQRYSPKILLMLSSKFAVRRAAALRHISPTPFRTNVLFLKHNTALTPTRLHSKLHACILGVFAKLRKETISFVMSVCLSVRPSVRPHGTTRLPLD